MGTFKIINETFGRYSINELGVLVSNDSGKIIHGSINSEGYLLVYLTLRKGEKRKLSLHRLVAKYFVANDKNKPLVNHINSIKTDNRAINLQWVTIAENNAHYRQSTQYYINTLKQEVTMLENKKRELLQAIHAIENRL